MGKSWKNRQHASTGYPYSHMRTSHVHIVRPKVRSEDGNSFFFGLFMDSAGVPGQSKDLSLADTRAVADLKRLAFIPSYSAYYSRKVASLYSKSRSRLPSALQPGLEAMETRMSAVGAPVVHAVQLRSEHLLSSLDRKVDEVCLAAQSWLWTKPGKARHPQGDTLVLRFNDGVPALGASPTLEKLFERAQPSLDFAAAKYMGAHDTVVSSEAYSKALQSAHAFLAQLQTFALFRSLYATISPLADPTLGNITQSTYYEAVIEHLKPTKSDAAHGHTPAGLAAS